MNIPALRGYLPESILEQIPQLVKRYQLSTPQRLAHFLSQCGHESAGFRVFSENLNYSAQGLLATFPKYFNRDTAAQYARQPERIANRVYANRMGNGPESSGDGWKFRGRGVIQLTGKNNYEAFNKSPHVSDNILENPDLVASKYAMESAAWFWDTNKLNKVADTGDVAAVTRRINGGTHGLADRQKRYKEVISLLSK